MPAIQTYEEILDIRLAEIANFARERKLSPGAVSSYFRAGEFANSVGRSDNYPSDAPHLQSLEAALDKLGEHVRKEGFSPIEVLKLFDMGNAAYSWLKDLKAEDRTEPRLAS